MSLRRDSFAATAQAALAIREVGFRHDGVCTVAVDGPAWATQLRYLEQGVVERVTQQLGPGIVTSVQVVVSPPPQHR